MAEGQPRCPRIDEFGITEIYAPQHKDQTTADIVFVHGLQGHPEKTWRYGPEPKKQPSSSVGEHSRAGFWKRRISGRNSSTSNSRDSSHHRDEQVSNCCFWPYDLLPKADMIDSTRILLYGYDSRVSLFYKGPTNQMTITQHAIDLMNKVALARTDCQGRPLIFIAHSLGGILVKGALVESAQMKYQPDCKDLSESCRAIFFMGTPHHGSELADWGLILSRFVSNLPGGPDVYEKVLEGLAPDSETLDTIARRFNEILIEPVGGIQICSIQEGNGFSSVKGFGRKIVPDHSSKFNRPEFERVLFNQNANHMKMCKFQSEDDSAYRDIMKTLQGYLKEIQRRRHEDQLAEEADVRVNASEFKKQLDYTGRLDREIQLKPLTINTQSFDWVWTSDFVKWLKSKDSKNKLFWIAGKAASGKSTLVKYLVDSLTREFRRPNAEPYVRIARFFFDFRGKQGMTNNFEGFRRSLLHQLLDMSPGLAADMTMHFNLGPDDDAFKLDTHELLAYALKIHVRPLLIFLDGLDEYQGHGSEIVCLIDGLIKFKVRICLSSRNESPFSVSYRDLKFQFQMDIVNKPGILAYVKEALKETLKPKGEADMKSIEFAASEISKNSHGVFLWARFAALEVIDAHCKGLEIDRSLMQRVVTTLPQDLEEIYSRIIKSMRNHERQACGIVLQLIEGSLTNPGVGELCLEQLCEATLLAGIKFRSLTKMLSNDDLAAFEQFVCATGSGLIEVHRKVTITELETLSDLHARIIHRTVRTYLEKRGWEEIFGKKPEPGSQQALWLKVCVRVLNDRPFTWLLPNSESQHPSYVTETAFFLQDYAYLNTLSHAESLENETERSSRHQLRLIMDKEDVAEQIFPSALEFLLILKWGNWKRFVRSHVHMAVLGELYYYVEEALEQSPAIADTGSGSFLSLLLDESDVAAIGNLTNHPPSENPSLLATAVLVAYYWWAPTSSSRDNARGAREDGKSMVRLLAPVSSRLGGPEMLFAIGSSMTRNEIDALLTHFEKGPLKLRSRIVGSHFEQWLSGVRKIAHLDAEFQFGPLWAVGARSGNLKQTEDVLRLFLDRGEDMNLECGPYGTILHSVIYRWSTTYYEDYGTKPWGPLLETLITHGADVNVAGPKGNVLEYTWTLLHSESSCLKREPHTLQGLIAFLIQKGAKNSRRDPNGRVPSIDRMLEVNRKLGPLAEDLSYYHYGTTSRAGEWRDV